MVKILFFAQLREALNCEQMEFELPSSKSVNWIRSQLAMKDKIWQQSLLERQLLFAVNQQLVGEDELVNDGDELAFLPPVTGG